MAGGTISPNSPTSPNSPIRKEPLLNPSRRITDEMRILALSRLTRDDLLLALAGPVVGMGVAVTMMLTGLLSPEWALITLIAVLVLSVIFAAGYSYHCLLSGLPYPVTYPRQRTRVLAMIQSEPELLGYAPPARALAEILSPGGLLGRNDIDSYRARLDAARERTRSRRATP